MGLFSPKPKPNKQILPALSYSQNATDGYESCCCISAASFSGRGSKGIRRREQMKRTGLLILILVSFLGFLDHFSILEFGTGGQIDIRNGFAYPANIENFPEVVQEFRFKIPNLSHAPITNQYSMVEFLHKAVPAKETMKPYGLLIVIKSAINNSHKRQAIRSTWGQLKYLEHTKLGPDLPTKLVFICGLPNPEEFDTVEELFPNEWNYNDIVVADYLDSYENNTYKSILALRWGVEFPADFQYLFLVDDDMYVDLINLQIYLQNFPNRTYEKKVDTSGSHVPIYQMSTVYNENRSLITGHSILNQGLYMGQVYWNAKPIRESWIFNVRKNEWVVPMEDYPYNYFPSYIPGAAIIFSKEAVHKMYYASFFVKPFKIDDVYFGIIAAKVGIIPVQNQHFFAWYNEHLYKLTALHLAESIAIHGFACTADMVELWTNRDLNRVDKCS